MRVQPLVCPECKEAFEHPFDGLFERAIVCPHCGCECGLDYEEIESDEEGFIEVYRLYRKEPN